MECLGDFKIGCVGGFKAGMLGGFETGMLRARFKVGMIWGFCSICWVVRFFGYGVSGMPANMAQYEW